MFEAIVVGFIFFTACYVVLMRIIARRADVLHGEFIQLNASPGAAPERSTVAVIERYLMGSRSLAKR